MDVLIRFGFSIENIQSMMDTNHFIDDMKEKEINDLIDILRSIGCTDTHIKDIFLCNPFYLTRNTVEVKELIHKLSEIGCTSLSLLFDSNPYLLNMEAQELDKFYNKKIHEGFSKEEIINYIHYNILF
jgi:hypothetical protein